MGFPGYPALYAAGAAAAYSMGMHPMHSMYSDDDDSGDEGEEGYCCERCHTFCDVGDFDPHNGLCYQCAEDIRPPGGCGCWRQTCPYLEEIECFECEA